MRVSSLCVSCLSVCPLGENDVAFSDIEIESDGRPDTEYTQLTILYIGRLEPRLAKTEVEAEGTSNVSLRRSSGRQRSDHAPHSLTLVRPIRHHDLPDAQTRIKGAEPLATCEQRGGKRGAAAHRFVADEQRRAPGGCRPVDELAHGGELRGVIRRRGDPQLVHPGVRGADRRLDVAADNLPHPERVQQARRGQRAARCEQDVLGELARAAR